MGIQPDGRDILSSSKHVDERPNSTKIPALIRIYIYILIPGVRPFPVFSDLP
jgi:hypothetical protein